MKGVGEGQQAQVRGGSPHRGAQAQPGPQLAGVARQGRAGQGWAGRGEAGGRLEGGREGGERCGSRAT